MDVYENILAKELGVMLLSYVKQIDTKNLSNRCEASCRLALNRIQAVINNEALTDFECIEEIILILERCGSDGGSRHDFG